MPGSKKVAKSSKKDVNPCKRRTDKIYKYAYKQAFKSTTFYMYCLGCVPVSSTKKPAYTGFFVLETGIRQLRCPCQTPSKPPLRGRLSRFAPNVWQDGDGCWLAPRSWVTTISTGAGCFRNRSVIK